MEEAAMIAKELSKLWDSASKTIETAGKVQCVGTGSRPLLHKDEVREELRIQHQRVTMINLSRAFHAIVTELYKRIGRLANGSFVVTSPRAEQLDEGSISISVILVTRL